MKIKANKDSIFSQISYKLGCSKLEHTREDVEAIIAVTNGFKEQGYRVSYSDVTNFITAEENKDILQLYGLKNVIIALPRMKLGPVLKEKKIGRNEICPCGCGNKYKKCINKTI